MSRILTHREIIPRRQDWLADEPVEGEPVSGGFPAIRENNREFRENLAVWQKATRQNAVESVSCRTIPYKMKQGINSRRTGNLLSRAGNLQRLAGNCRPCAGISPDLSRLPRRGVRHLNAEASYEWSSFRKRTDHVQLGRESATLTPSVEGRCSREEAPI